MALTITPIKVRGDINEVVADVTFDSSYPTGGEALAAADLGFNSLHWLQAEQKGLTTRICLYDYANSKLLLFTYPAVAGDPVQAANASDQSTIVVRVRACGDWIGPESL